MKKFTQMLLLLLACSSLKAQITYSITIPDKIPEYDGSYEDFGQGHLFYPNEHETRCNDKDNSSAIEYVQFYTLNAHPKKYILRTKNICFNFAKRDTSNGAITDSLHRVDVEMYKSNPSAFLARVDTQNTAVLNYFNQWYGATGRTNVKGGAAIACQSIWKNIDLVYTSNNRGLKMYFIVYPGGDPKDVILQIKGARANGISGSSLKFDANWDGASFIKPRMYQYTISGSVVTPVTVCNASWQSLGSDRYGISTTSSYVSSLPLIIEVMENVASTAALTGVDWSTYIGGSMQDLIYKARSDGSNNLFTSGATTSPNFPVNAGPAVVTNNIGSAVTSALTSNGFIAKFNPSGVMQWVTNVGGSNAEEIYDFDFKSGSMYCIGRTNSNNMPVQPKTGALNNSTYGGGFRDGYVFQLSANGQTNSWLSYFGGNGWDEFSSCKFDASGALFVVGFSNSSNKAPFGAAGTYTQVYNTSQPGGWYDGIIMKFRASSDTLDWFTFYGTDVLTGGFQTYDELMGIEINGTDVYACGYAGGTNLPGSINSKFQTNYFDGILAKFTTSGALVTAKYTNGNAWNRVVKINNGRVYTTGLAKNGMTLKNSGDYYYDPICTLSDDDGCFAVHNLNIDTTYHCTYLGDQGPDEANDIQFAPNGVFYIAGFTQASSYPVVNTISGMYTSALTNIQSYFVSAFKQNDVNMVWSTTFGSQGQDVEGFGNQNENRHCTTIALDGLGDLYLCGVTKSFTFFPLSNPGGGTYFQAFSASNSNNNATWNGTITRFNVTAVNTWVGIKELARTPVSIALYPNPTSYYVIIDDAALQNQSLEYSIYDLVGRKWSEGKLNQGKQKNIDVSSLPQGVYLINLNNGTQAFSSKIVKTDN